MICDEIDSIVDYKICQHSEKYTPIEWNA